MERPASKCQEPDKGDSFSMIAASACLLGVPCRYNGRAKCCDGAALLGQGAVMILCPEALAGAPTPRLPMEIVGGDGADVLDGKARVVRSDGVDCTAMIILGCEKALDACVRHGVQWVLLQANSPTCGSGMIYDGTFSGAKRAGDGVFAAMLKRAGLEVRSVEGQAVPSGS